jgi:hypothetical protein
MRATASARSKYAFVGTQVLWYLLSIGNVDRILTIPLRGRIL